MAIRFLISNSPDNLRAALEGSASATVEAEYGDACVEGSILTMAHHGKNAGNPAPCSYPNGCADGVETVGLSHFDLDTLGGCAAIIARKPTAETFWALAEYIDLNGAHKLAEGIEKTSATEDDECALHAFWAWSQANRCFPPRDGSVADVTDAVLEGVAAIDRILARDEGLLAAGDVFKAAGEELNASSFLEESEGVIVRAAAAFTNHIYNTPVGEVAAAVVAYNQKFGSITISFADGEAGGNAREIVQGLWGELAGGHAGIAGSPRGQRMSLADLVAAAEATRTVLS